MIASYCNVDNQPVPSHVQASNIYLKQSTKPTASLTEMTSVLGQALTNLVSGGRSQLLAKVAWRQKFCGFSSTRLRRCSLGGNIPRGRGLYLKTHNTVYQLHWQHPLWTRPVSERRTNNNMRAVSEGHTTTRSASFTGNISSGRGLYLKDTQTRKQVTQPHAHLEHHWHSHPFQRKQEYSHTFTWSSITPSPPNTLT